MTILNVVESLDDETGDLARTYAKLKMEERRGLSLSPESIDFIEELYQAALRKHVTPLKSRIAAAGLSGAFLFFAPSLLPTLSVGTPGLVLGIRIIAMTLFLGALVWTGVDVKRWRHFVNMRDKAKTSILEGTSIFDL